MVRAHIRHDLRAGQNLHVELLLDLMDFLCLGQQWHDCILEITLYISIVLCLHLEQTEMV